MLQSGRGQAPNLCPVKEQGHMKKKIEGENQATQIMRSSQISVFFIDDFQKISRKDIGSVELLKAEAA